jgi:N-acetylneuraminate synthase
MTSTYIIAEAGVNHNGTFEMAKQLIDVAAEAGADAVKFQTFKSENVISRFAPKAEYQKSSTGEEESQLEMAKKLEFDYLVFGELSTYCESKNIQFLSTPFEFTSLNYLVNDLKVKQLKLPSGEITNAPFLLKAAQSGLPIILSTGMSTLGEVETALSIIAHGYTSPGTAPSQESFLQAYYSEAGQKALLEKVTVLHCTTEYPAPFCDINLRVMDTLKTAFGLPLGLSDHSNGITVSIAAVARDAVMVEKHFTLDKSLPGPDHLASLEPDELKAMVKGIREVEQALGRTLKLPVTSEIKNKPIARKSLIAKRAIKKGEPFTEENLTVKRPGTGISPLFFWDWMGKTADKSYQADELIEK